MQNKSIQRQEKLREKLISEKSLFESFLKLLEEGIAEYRADPEGLNAGGWVISGVHSIKAYAEAVQNQAKEVEKIRSQLNEEIFAYLRENRK